MKLLIALTVLLLLVGVVESATVLGTFTAGDTFDILSDGSLLTLEGITADNTILIVRKLGDNIKDYLPVAIPSMSKAFIRTVAQTKYSFTVYSNHSVQITRMD